MRKAAKLILPGSVYAYVRRLRGRTPNVGDVRFGDLRSLEPISRDYGFGRGRPVDRYYIENFLAANGEHIRGEVLEIGENTYTKKFGRSVTRSAILHVSSEADDVTYVDDLTDGWSIPSNAFDCVILTQTLHLIYDMKAALATIYRILKPGGVLLATVPGITQISDEEWNGTWFWSLTEIAARRVVGEIFPPGSVHAETFGNVLAATAFLQGLADIELTKAELDHLDREYPVTVTIKAFTGNSATRVPMSGRWNYEDKRQFAYDEDTSYRRGMEFLDGHGRIEDWGCGTAFAKRFVTRSEYVGIDGSASEFVDQVTDLQEHRSPTDCIFMRHVLEHNWGWRAILRNAVDSFRDRMVLVVFTPFGDSEAKLTEHDGVPDLALEKTELLSYFVGCAVREETFQSATQYGQETIFYVEKPTHA